MFQNSRKKQKLSFLVLPVLQLQPLTSRNAEAFQFPVAQITEKPFFNPRWMLLVAFLWKFYSSGGTKLCSCCRLVQAGARSSSPEPAPKEKVSAAFLELLSLMDLHSGNCWWTWHCANVPVVEMQTIMKRSLTPWTLPRSRSRSWLATTKLWKLLMGTCWRSSGTQRWGSVWPESCCTGSRDVSSFNALTVIKEEIYSGGRDLVLIGSWWGLDSKSWALWVPQVREKVKDTHE